MNCNFCGKLVEQPKLGRPKLYCDHKCRYDMKMRRWRNGSYRYREPFATVKNERQCKRCCKWFIPINRRNVYCSFECTPFGVPKGVRILKCPCGKIHHKFRIRKNSQFCCGICYKRWRRGIKFSRCLVCNKEFVKTNKHYKYCSDECGDKSKIAKYKNGLQTGRFSNTIKKHRAKYPDWYVRESFARRSSINTADIPQSVIEVQRLKMLITKEIRNKCQPTLTSYDTNSAKFSRS